MAQRKKRKSEYIQQYVDNLYQFEIDHPDELFPMETDPQFVVYCLCDVFLGVDWYTVDPISTKQVNTLILDRILWKHSREFRRAVREKRKIWRKKYGHK